MVLGLKEGLIECATVFVKSEVILIELHQIVSMPSVSLYMGIKPLDSKVQIEKMSLVFHLAIC